MSENDKSNWVTTDNIVWVSANEFIEAQTRQIEREFKCSLPRPRNKVMGFRGDDKRRKNGAQKSAIGAGPAKSPL